MQANELRIGNWVNIQGEFDSKIHSIENGRLWCKDGEQMICSTVFRFHAIPLTPEVLEKCGALDFECHWELGDIHLTWGSRIVATGERCSISVVGSPHVQYLHQLQNLYFALTNNELIYNP